MNRRSFLQQSMVTAMGGFAASAADAAPATRIMDTHTHFYDPTRPEGVPWPPKDMPLYRPVYPKDWKAVAASHGVKETIVIEASNRAKDNDWVLDLAAGEKCIVGFVGNLEPMDPSFTATVKRLSANALFLGIRRAGGVLYDNITKPEFRSGMKLLAGLGLTLDTNDRRPGGLQSIGQLAAAIPDLRIIVDHAGWCGDARKLNDDWKQGMKALGGQKNVFCKVSGLIELTDEASAHYGHAPRDTAYYTPILDHCWNCFGPERLIYGSNWPVCEIGGTYADQFRMLEEYFAAKGAEACEQYYWKNSLAAYRWKERGE